LPRKRAAKAEKPERAEKVEKAEKGEDSSRAAVVGRPVWSGSIAFGLVSVPVELVSAQRRVGLPVRTLSPKGNFLKRQYVCPRDEEVLTPDDIERGYEVQKDEFVRIADQELDELAPRSSREIDLQQFVPRDSIDPAFFVKSYFVLPSGDQTKAYRLLAETMERTERVAIAKFVMRSKGYAVALFAQHGILRAEILRFHDEVRRPDDLELTAPVRPEPARVLQMTEAIRSLSADSVAEDELVYDDTRRIVELARAKAAKREGVVEVAESVRVEADEESRDVIDLVAALKDRLAKKREPARATKGGAKAPAGKKKAASRARA
jgi:DNA end-binding protein Ku